jgi:hypothetical protein
MHARDAARWNYCHEVRVLKRPGNPLAGEIEQKANGGVEEGALSSIICSRFPTSHVTVIC